MTAAIELHDEHVKAWTLRQLVAMWIREYGVEGARRLIRLHGGLHG